MMVFNSKWNLLVSVFGMICALSVDIMQGKWPQKDVKSVSFEHLYALDAQQNYKRFSPIFPTLTIKQEKISFKERMLQVADLHKRIDLLIQQAQRMRR